MRLYHIAEHRWRRDITFLALMELHLGESYEHGSYYEFLLGRFSYTFIRQRKLEILA